MAGLDLDFTEVTLKDLVAKGYIRVETARGNTRFVWADDNR
jgi:hypothetical protein